MTIAFERDAGHATVAGAALTLLLTVLGTLLAVFVADVIAHMVRDSSLPSRAELAGESGLLFTGACPLPKLDGLVGRECSRASSIDSESAAASRSRAPTPGA